MPSTCCVRGCKSNYTSTLKSGGLTVSRFRFPRDDILKAEWLKAISRGNWSPAKYSVVCSEHFPEDDIIKEDIYLLPNGTVKNFQSKPRLKPNVVPSIFPNDCDNNLIKKVSVPRKGSEENDLSDSFKESDLINSFEDLILNYLKKIDISDSWTIKLERDSKIYFYTLNLTEEPIRIVNQISVDTNMVVKVFVSSVELTFEDLNWIFAVDLKLTRWSQLERLLIGYGSCKFE